MCPSPTTTNSTDRSSSKATSKHGIHTTANRTFLPWVGGSGLQRHEISCCTPSSVEEHGQPPRRETERYGCTFTVRMYNGSHSAESVRDSSVFLAGSSPLGVPPTGTCRERGAATSRTSTDVKTTCWLQVTFLAWAHSKSQRLRA